MLLKVDFAFGKRHLLPIVDVVGRIRIRNSKEDYTRMLLGGAVKVIENAGKYNARLLESSPPIKTDKSFQIVYFSLIFPSEELAEKFGDSL